MYKTNEIEVENTQNNFSKARILVQNKLDFIPKISVIIPVYNTQNYLKKCLESVINQSFKKIEIICVDDGSSDDSLNILKKYAAKDKRISILSQKNHHAGVARNAGMMVACGEYYHFLDSDDWLEEGAYESLKNYDDDIIIFKYNNFDTYKNEITSTTGIFENFTKVKKINPKNYSNKLFQLSNPMPWNKLIKSHIAKQVRFQSLRASNDIYFSFMSMALSKSILLINKPLINYRYNRLNSLKNTRDKSPNDFFYAYKYLKQRLKECLIFDEFKQSFYISLISSSLWTIDNVTRKDDVRKFIKEYILSEIDFSLVDENLRNLFLCKVNHKIIVSLTSYKARIGFVHKAIKSILNQSIKPDKVVLWLVPNECDLPKDLLDLQNEGLEIDYYHDIKSYKKLIPALKKYPNDIIITVDDDLIYDKDLIKNLLSSYEKDCIISSRLTRLLVDENANISVANRDLYEDADAKTLIDFLKIPSFLNSLNSGSGCLFAPGIFNGSDILNEDLFLKFAPTCDDLWFYIQALIKNIKIKYPNNPNPRLEYINNSQNEALWKVNNANDREVFYKCLNDLLKHYKINLLSHLDESLEFDKLCAMFLKHKASYILDSRIDIKNSGYDKNSVKISKYANNIKAIKTLKSRGFSFIGNDDLIEFKIIKNGKLVIDLLSDNDEIIYEQIYLNNKKLLKEPIKINKGALFKIKKLVLNNQSFKLKIAYKGSKNFKINIRNVKTAQNNIKLLNYISPLSISEPAWFSDDLGQGCVVSSKNYKDRFKLKIKGDGQLVFKFMGADKKYDGKRLPLYVNYQSIKINQNEILAKPVSTCYANAFVYKMSVFDGDELDVKVSKSAYAYTKDELKDLIIKLLDGEVPKDIDKIVDENIKNRLEYEKLNKAKLLSKIFSITKEKYKTRYCFLGLKYVRFNQRREILDMIKDENAKLRREIIELKNKIEKLSNNDT